MGLGVGKWHFGVKVLNLRMEILILRLKMAKLGLNMWH